ncbi:MAG: copper amine oxidase N-terminal domain-containing protein [Defluviitaleaceae bacterium]|nr:copper amine oxidase N-terminal domain-containing protein [Defluviitaleaceae bacterium]
MNDFELQISPVTDYKAPEIPMFGDNNSDILKKLPSRWQKNAKVIASLGLVGIFALSGCDGRDNINWRQNNIEYNLGYAQGIYNGYSESELLVRLHTGGGGGSGYIVHLTEQEAFGIIRARLGTAGLVFGSIPPGYTVRERGLDLYDARKGVGITFVGWVGENRAWRMNEREIAWRFSEDFEERTNNIIVGAFYDGGRGLGWGQGPTPSLAEAEAERSALNRQLINQADVFIARLQSEGILEPFPDVRITIDGRAFHSGAIPIIVNNHKMVPAVEFFEMLGMEIVRQENRSERGGFDITARKDNVMIWATVRPRWTSLEIAGGRDDFDRWADSDIPVFVLNDEMLVPLRYVAEAIGADVEWDEETRTFTVTTP